MMYRIQTFSGGESEFTWNIQECKQIITNAMPEDLRLIPFTGMRNVHWSNRNLANSQHGEMVSQVTSPPYPMQKSVVVDASMVAALSLPLAAAETAV